MIHLRPPHLTVLAFSPSSNRGAGFFRSAENTSQAPAGNATQSCISYDDGYNPAKTVEQARKLVEDHEVLLIFNSLGAPGNTAIQKYMNAKKVPQLFVSTGATKWNDPKNFPWTMGWEPNYQIEARIYAAYILKNLPGKTVGILYQNDDFGKDYVIGMHDGLGDQASKLIVVESSYETSSPTVDSQIVQIKSANPDILINISTPKFAAQSIKKAAELKWKPIHFLTNVSVSVGSVMKPAGYPACFGAGLLRRACHRARSPGAGRAEWWMRRLS